MKQNVKNNNPQDALQHSRTNKLIRRLAAEKKKTVFAVCLIMLMVFMWARVLGRKTPKTAEAALGQEVVNSGITQSGPQLKVTFIELPKVAGRNDEITRDVFALDDWRNLIMASEGRKIADIEEVSVSKGGSEDIARRVAEKLKLEAIAFGENPRAFINSKTLSIGDKLSVIEGEYRYECEVVGIEEDKVFIRCEEATITLKLKGVVEVTN